MTSPPKAGKERVRVLPAEAWHDQLDEQARRSLGISADEFIARYKAGVYGDPDANPDVMWLVMLIPDDWLV